MKLCAFLFLTALLACAVQGFEPTDDYSFKQYVKDFDRTYSSAEEYASRQALFERRLNSVLQHNAAAAKVGGPTWTRGINNFSDRTEEEINLHKGLDKHMLHYNRQVLARAAGEVGQKGEEVLASLPTSLDWREHNVVTPVKNQGQCGSCWTFASTETIESHWAIKTGHLEELSEQFILDCTPNPNECGGTGGCGGGTAELAYDRLKTLGGIPSEWTYSYISGDGTAGKCRGTFPLPPAAPHHGGIAAAANVTGHVSVSSNSYQQVMVALALKGPLAVSVDAGAWHDYESGVFTGGNSTNPDLDHLVQLIGYGTDESGVDYWLVRNSWTPLWGENGFIRLRRFGAQGESPCGVDLTPLDGNGCKGGPATVKVCGQNGVLYDAVYPLV